VTGARGFSLLETIVALGVLALVVTLATGLGQRALDLRGRLGDRLTASAIDRVAHGWLRDSVEAMIADVDLPAFAFSGDVAGFTGVTAHPLDRPIGVTSRVGWRIVATNGGEALVHVTGEGEVWPVWSWSRPGARFAYLGPDLAWTESWAGPTPPRLLRLWFPAPDGTRVWLAAPRAAP
jgi:prepilin-type N-terminal cleavage/methylation domain-containing protein